MDFEAATELVRIILRGMCKVHHTDRRIYVWSRARVNGNNIVFIRDTVEGFRDKGLLPIDDVGAAFKFPFVVFCNINFVDEGAAKVFMVMYLLNKYEPLGIKLRFARKLSGRSVEDLNIVLVG